jgi:hypothetical protein
MSLHDKFVIEMLLFSDGVWLYVSRLNLTKE